MEPAEGGALEATGWDRSLVRALALLVCLLVAAVVRLWGIDYGIPHPTARPDEELVVQRAFSMVGKGDPDPRFFEYPSLAIYATALAMEAYYEAGKLEGRYDRTFDFLFDAVVLRPGLSYRIGRGLSLLFALLTVVATFVLGWEYTHRLPLALLAAFLLSVNFLHTVFSRFDTVDVSMTLLVTGSLVFSLRATRRQSWRDYLLAGTLAGLAASAKYNAGLVGLALVPAVFAVFTGHADRVEKIKSVGKLASAAIASLLAFVVTSPYALVHWEAVQAGLEKHSYFYTNGPDPLGLWVHLGTTFPVGLGWPLYLGSLLGVALAVRRRKPRDQVLLVFFLAFFALIAGVHVVYPRYVLPLVPVMVVFAAEAVGTLLPRRWAVVAAILAFAVPNLASAVRFDRLAARRDTRLLASEWIKSHIPKRSRILVCQGYGAPEINADRRRPPAFEPRKVNCRPETLLAGGSRFVVTHEHPVLTKYSSIAPDTRRWLEERAEVRARFDPFRPGRPGAVATPLFFYSDAFYLPLAGFSAVERGGPIVTIWELRAPRE